MLKVEEKYARGGEKICLKWRTYKKGGEKIC